jgi:single-stranded-DNA-specific exonuclease
MYKLYNDDCLKYLKSLKDNEIDVLITDHHTPNGHTPKNVWIIDAHYNNDNEDNKGLCGAAVAFKLAMTLLDRYEEVNSDDLYYKYLVHVAIATITDSMPITIENIKYVYNGLQLLKDGYASDAINHYKEYNSNTDLTPKDLAFGLGPQINACGRMNNTALALNYLFSDEEDVEDLYNEIVYLNDERKDKTKKSIEKAEKSLDVNSPSIILELGNVEGIAGIIASNLANKYKKCTIIFSKDTTGKYLIGSARSDGQTDLLSLIRGLNHSSVVKVGGHSAACGITIKASGLNSFIKEINNAINELPIIETEESQDIEIVVDGYITVSDINKDNCKLLQSLYFFTEATPVFALTNVTIDNVKYSNKNTDNICYTISDETGSTSTWDWGTGNMYKEMGSPKNVTLIAEFDLKFGKPALNIINIIPKGEIA